MLNRYPYALGNPVNLTDATGQAISEALLIVALGVGQLVAEAGIFTAITGDTHSGLLATGAMQAAQLGILGALSGIGVTATGIAVGSPFVTGFGLAQTLAGANLARVGFQAVGTILKKGRDIETSDLREILFGPRGQPTPEPTQDAAQCGS